MAEEVSAAAGVAGAGRRWRRWGDEGGGELAEEVMTMAMLAAVAEPAADQQGCLGKAWRWG